MTTDKDNGEIQSPGEPGKPAGRPFHPALPVTVILAVLVAAVLLPGILSDDEEPLPDVTNRIAVPLAQTEAPASAQELSPEALEDLRPAPVEGLIDPEPLLLGLLPRESGGTADDEPAVAETTPEAPATETPVAPEEPFSVGEALARYLLAVRADLNSEYVANCIRFRNRNGAGAGCPDDPAFNADNYQQEQALVDELFAIITREEDYARISSRLERENETLAAILDDPDNPAALQASTKLALNNSYLSYLNGNPNPDVVAFSTMNDFVNDYNRTILVGPTQFRCQGGPCVFEYNGPGAEEAR